MTWQLAIGISVLSGIVTALIQRQYSQKSTAPPSFPPAVSYLLGVLPVGFIAGIFFLPHAIYWSWSLVVLLLIEGIVMAVSLWTSFRVTSELSVTTFQTINRFYQVVAIVLGWTLLGEHLTTYQLIGAVILLFAALLAIRAPLQAKTATTKKSNTTYIFLAVISSITLGIGLVTEKAILGHMQIGWSAQAIGMVLLAAKDVNRRTLRAFRAEEFKGSIMMGLANGLSGIFYVYAIVHSNNISLITAVSAVSLPLTVLGAYLFLHEREHKRLVWVSLGISFIGLIVSALH
jgi:drug/metabolite transporter (DMT)-like permease